MKIDRFLQLFVVKEKKFYPLHIEQAANIEAAAKLLVGCYPRAKTMKRAGSACTRTSKEVRA